MGKLDDVIHVTVDAHWAGDPKTRCSTSRVLAIGPCFTVRHWSVTQATVLLSSAESEAKAITEGCIASLYAKHLQEHQTAQPFKIEVWTDSSSAKAIMQRLGPGWRCRRCGAVERLFDDGENESLEDDVHSSVDKTSHLTTAVLRWCVEMTSFHNDIYTDHRDLLSCVTVLGDCWDDTHKSRSVIKFVLRPMSDEVVLSRLLTRRGVFVVVLFVNAPREV